MAQKKQSSETQNKETAQLQSRTTSSKNTKIQIPIRFRHQYNFILQKSDMEKISSKSKTVQADAFTVRELLQRYTVNNGYPVKEKHGTFTENPTHDDEVGQFAPDFDLTDEAILRSRAQLTIDQAIEENKLRQQKINKDKEDEAFQKKLKIHEQKRNRVNEKLPSKAKHLKSSEGEEMERNGSSEADDN